MGLHVAHSSTGRIRYCPRERAITNRSPCPNLDRTTRTTYDCVSNVENVLPKPISVLKRRSALVRFVHRPTLQNVKDAALIRIVRSAQMTHEPLCE